jgi:hypothetical protein
MPGQFVPSPKNRAPRLGGSRVSRTGRWEESGPLSGPRPPNSSAAIYKTPENEQRAKPDQEHSGLSQLIAATHNRTWIQADGGRIFPAAGTIVAVRVLDRPARINLRAFFTKRNVLGSPLGPSAFIGDWECCAPACLSRGARHARDSKIYLTTTPNHPAPLLGMPIAHGDSADRESPRGF